MNFLKIKQGALALAFVCVGIFTTGCCAGTYEVLDSQTEQELATVNLNDCYCSLILTTNCSLNLSNSYC